MLLSEILDNDVAHHRRFPVIPRTVENDFRTPVHRRFQRPALGFQVTDIVAVH